MYHILMKANKLDKRPKYQGVVFRGGCMSTILSKYRYGATITNRTFMGAASSSLAAKERLYQHRGKKEHTMGLFCVIKLNGYSGVNISDINSNEDILLMPGARFKVRSLYIPAYSEADMQNLDSLKSYIQSLNTDLEEIRKRREEADIYYQIPASMMSLVIQSMHRKKANKGMGLLKAFHETTMASEKTRYLKHKLITRELDKQEAEILTKINNNQAKFNNIDDGGFLFDFMQDRIKNHLSKDDFKSECKGNTTFLFLEELPGRGQSPHKRMDNRVLDREDDTTIDSEMENPPKIKNSPSKSKNFFSALFNRKMHNRLSRRVVDREDNTTIKSIVDNLPKTFSKIKYAPPEKKNFFSSLFNRKKNNRLDRRVLDREKEAPVNSGVENLPRQNSLSSKIKNFFYKLFTSYKPSHKVTWTDILTYEGTTANSGDHIDDILYQNPQFVPESSVNDVSQSDTNHNAGPSGTILSDPVNEPILSELEASITSHTDEPIVSDSVDQTDSAELAARVTPHNTTSYETIFSDFVAQPYVSKVASLEVPISPNSAASYEPMLSDYVGEPIISAPSITPRYTKSDSTRLEDLNNDSEPIVQNYPNKKTSKVKNFFKALFSRKNHDGLDNRVFPEEGFSINPVVQNLPKQNKKPKISAAYETPKDYNQLRNIKHLYNSEENLNFPTTVAFH